jgi:formylglycine-generating enzyme
MVGNAKEWCFDWYAKDYYQHSPKNNPKGLEKEISRVRRDGGLQTWPRGQRSAARFASSPDLRSVGIGFRLIMKEGNL